MIPGGRVSVDLVWESAVRDVAAGLVLSEARGVPILHVEYMVRDGNATRLLLQRGRLTPERALDWAARLGSVPAMRVAKKHGARGYIRAHDYAFKNGHPAAAAVLERWEARR